MCAVICRKVTFTASASPFRFPMPIPYLPEHKNPDFVFETPKNGGSECKKRTKMELLCAFLFRKAAHCGPRCLRLALGTAQLWSNHLRLALGTAQLWSNHLRPVLRLASGLVANESTACGADCLWSRLPVEPTACRADYLQGRPSAEPTVCGADCLRSQPPVGLEA